MFFVSSLLVSVFCSVGLSSVTVLLCRGTLPYDYLCVTLSHLDKIISIQFNYIIATGQESKSEISDGKLFNKLFCSKVHGSSDGLSDTSQPRGLKQTMEPNHFTGIPKS